MAFGQTMNIKEYPISFYRNAENENVLLDPSSVKAIRKLGFDNWVYIDQSVVTSDGIGYIYYKTKPGFTNSDVWDDYQTLKRGEFSNWKMKKGGWVIVYDKGLWGNLSIWRPDLTQKITDILKIGLPIVLLLLLTAKK